MTRLDDVKARHAGEHECTGSVGEAIYDPGTPCEATWLIARVEELSAALRDAVAVAHETDSLRSHSDGQRTDGWFRAPLERCEDALCADARAALRNLEAEQ